MNKISSDNEAAFHFIRDEPADTDFLGSHGRLAASIAKVIRQTRDLKVIGLLGSWGAGKSTVVRLVQQELQELDKASGEQTHCFFYDAWLHQNDPPRRAFLEELIDFLINEKQTKRELWQRKLDALNRKTEESETTSTPMLTTSGKLIAFSFLFWPISFSLLGHDWFEAAFQEKAPLHDKIPIILGGILFFLPLIVLFCTYLCWRPTWNIFSGKFYSINNFMAHKEPHQNDSIFSIFLNKEIQTQRNRTTRSPDPTAIEFQDFFREIMGAVKGEKKRFIFIIDNLDRLPEGDAVAMWGTIRSFFLGSHGVARILKPEDMPIVILPIDEQAICRMYNASHEKEDAQTLARSFMDKTFDLTFHVPRPVLSDWNKYLSAQMAKVFGPRMDKNWSYITGRFYERYLINQSEFNVTPRTINTLINSIAVLWLQWWDRDVTFAAVSYYSIFRDAINANILQAVQSQLAPVADLDPDWQRGIAAIHYGASPDEAGQILIEQPLRKAIGENNTEAFSSLRNIPSFDRVLLRILDGFASGNIIPDVIFRAAIILQNLGESKEPWFDDAWHRLHAAFKLTGQWQRFDSEEGEGVVALVEHCQKNEFISFLSSLDENLASLANNALSSSQFSKAFATAWGAVSNVAKSAEWPLSLVQVPGDANVFLDVAVSSYENQELTKKFISKVTSDELTHQVALCLADQARAITAEKKFLALHRLDRTFDWTELATSAIAICRDQNAVYLGMSSALFILGKLGASDNGIKAQIKSLIASGHLATRLNEAFQQKISLVIARTLALLIIGENYTFPIPNNGIWNSLFEQDLDFVHFLNDAFVEFSSEYDSKFLFESARSNPALITIVGAVIRLRLQAKDLGPLNLTQIINDLPQYLRCIDDSLQDSFIVEISEYTSFWNEFTKQPFEGNALTVLRTLMKETGETGQKAKATLIDKLNGVEPAKWSNAVRTQTEPLLIANDLATMPDTSFEIGQNLYDGLQALIGEILGNADGKFRRQWFSATQFLSINARQTVLSNMRDGILGTSSVVQLPSLLFAGNTALLESGGFSDKADDCARHIVLHLFDDAKGVEWILENSNTVMQWINGAKETTRGFLRERLVNLVEDKKPDYTDNLHRLLEQWFPDKNSANTSETSPVA